MTAEEGRQRLEAVLADTEPEPAALVWRAVVLRRTGRFPEARRAFRALRGSPVDERLFEAALAVLRAAGGFRWATEAAAHLAARGTWDPIWFVDAWAAAHAGLLSPETTALLEEIQRAERQLLVDTGADGSD